MYTVNFYTYLIILFICFLSSLRIYYRKKQPFYLKLFPPFLLGTLIIEVIAHILIRKGIDNSSLYHYFFPIEITFFLYIGYHILSRKRLKRAIVVLTSIYVLAISIYYALNEINGFPTLAYFSGAALVIFFYSFYFFEIVRLPINLTPKREESFWIFFGVVLFYSTTLPIWLTVTFMVPFSKGTLDFISTLLMLMNFALYLSLTIAFFCKRIFKEKEGGICDFNRFSESYQTENLNTPSD